MTLSKQSMTVRSQSGAALLLTLLIFLILAAVVSELVISSRLDYAVAKNECDQARLDSAMETALIDALDKLKQDGISDSSAGQSQQGAVTGAPGTSPGSEQQQQGPYDARSDEWAQETETTFGEVRVTVRIEDENRKFNLLSLLSPDEQFAKDSLQRLVRILDRFREETRRDLDSYDAERIANGILAYLKGTERPDGVPRPALMTDKPDTTSYFPLSIDELLFVKDLTSDLLYDSEEPLREGSQETVVYPGLASLLTVWTSIQPFENASQSAANATTGSNQANANTNTNTNSAQNTGAGTSGSSLPDVGVRININTAHRAVLTSLFLDNELPPDVIEGILKYRNLEQEVTEDSSSSTETTTGSEFDEVKPKQYFGAISDLDKVPEFLNFGDQRIKDNFKKLLSVRSDVFSIYLTARLVDSGGTTTGTIDESKTSGEEDGKLVRRVRAVYWRRQTQNGVQLLPILSWEVRRDRKINLEDFTPEQMPTRF